MLTGWLHTHNTQAGEFDTSPSSTGQDELPLTLEGASKTMMQTLHEVTESFLAHLPLIIAGLLVLLVTALLAYIGRHITERLLSGVRMRKSLKALVVRFQIFGVWALGLLLAAMVAFPGLTPSKALTALGIGSLAIGLAFRDIFENFFAGVLILWRFPLENGDWITCKGITGRVVDVTVRNTVLRTVRDELIVMPNSDLYKNPVDILTNRPNRRIEIICGVAYGESVAEAREVIHKAVNSCDTVSPDHDIQVFANAFADSSVNFEIAWWTGAEPLEQRRSRDQVIQAVKEALDEAGIEIPFPYRTLTFKDGVPIKQPTESKD